MCGLCLYIKLKNALKNKNNNCIRQEVHVLPTGKKEVSQCMDCFTGPVQSTCAC